MANKKTRHGVSAGFQLPEINGGMFSRSD